MAVTDYSHEPCKKCGKLTPHLSNVCAKCRKLPCPRCGKPVADAFKRKVCAKCFEKNKRLYKGYPEG